MFDGFTLGSIEVIRLAQEEGRRNGLDKCGSEQILFGIFRESESIGAEALKQAGFDLEFYSAFVSRNNPGTNKSDSSIINFTANATSILKSAFAESLKTKDHMVDTEHLLLGLLELDKCNALEILKKSKIDIENLRDIITFLVSQKNSQQR